MLDSMEAPNEYLSKKRFQNIAKTDIRSFKAFYEGSAGVEDSGVITAITGDNQLESSIGSVVESKNKRDVEGLYQLLMSIACALPERSRAYYERAFAVLSSVENFKSITSKLDNEKNAKLGRRLSEDVSCLINHKAVLELASIDVRERRGIIKERLNMDQILAASFSMLDRVSTLVYKKSLKALYEAAKGGDDEALFKLLKLDKTLFDAEWVRDLMFRGMLLGDEDFFKKVGYAISVEPPVGKLRRGKLKFILMTFWNCGLSRLSVPQLMQLIEDSGVELQDDPESFRAFIKNEIKPLFR